MSRIIKILWLSTVFTLLGLSACGGGGAASPTIDPLALYTQIAETAFAIQTQTALAVPTATNTPEASPTSETPNTPLITDTFLPGTPSVTSSTLNTPQVTNTSLAGISSITPFSLNTPKPPQQASCDNMTIFEDVNFPDGTEVAPGKTFVKTWRFTNAGPCSWNTNYRLIYGWQSGGTDWNKLTPVKFPDDVLPGETIEISVTLTAPTAPGGYGAWFRLQNDKGFNFGEVFAVYIKVK